MANLTCMGYESRTKNCYNCITCSIKRRQMSCSNHLKSSFKFPSGNHLQLALVILWHRTEIICYVMLQVSLAGKRMKKEVFAGSQPASRHVGSWPLVSHKWWVWRWKMWYGRRHSNRVLRHRNEIRLIIEVRSWCRSQMFTRESAGCWNLRLVLAMKCYETRVFLCFFIGADVFPFAVFFDQGHVGWLLCWWLPSWFGLWSPGLWELMCFKRV